MINAMMCYIWPKDDALVRKRFVKLVILITKVYNIVNTYFLYDSVAISLGLLAGSKLLTVCVPFMFKEAVDMLGVLNMDTPADTVLSGATALLLGCK